jgi:hypothetical protein
MVLRSDHFGGLGRGQAIFKLLLGTLLGRLDSIPTLDNIGLEADWTRTAVELEEETAGVAQD